MTTRRPAAKAPATRSARSTVVSEDATVAATPQPIPDASSNGAAVASDPTPPGNPPEAAPNGAAAPDSALAAAAAEIERLRHQLEPDEDPELDVKDKKKTPAWKIGYPYPKKISREEYEATKYALQIELLKLQAWVKDTGQKIVIFFEGRDAAGKGGSIKRFTEHMNPRGARVVALSIRPRSSAASGTSSATSPTCPRPVRSSCSTAPGTTGPGSSG